MIPIYDDNPALGKPILVVGIIVLCVIIWFWQSGLGYQVNNQMIISYGLTPAAFLGKTPPAWRARPRRSCRWLRRVLDPCTMGSCRTC